MLAAISVAAIAAVLLATAGIPIAAADGNGAVTEFHLDTADAVPTAVTTTPDGSVWVADSAGQVLVAHPYTDERIEAAIDRIGLGDVHGLPTSLAPGPDGAVWVTEQLGNRISRVLSDGETMPYPLPTPGSEPTAIVAGPDGALWFTERGGNRIGRITVGGAISEYPVPTPDAQPSGITVGPDGAIWFTEQAADRIGRITTTGSIEEFPLPSDGAGPAGITAGPDRALWFTEQYGNAVGRIGIDSEHEVDETPLPTEAAFPEGIVLSRGALWFTERDQHQIGRITPGSEDIREYALPASSGPTSAVTSSCDGRIWFAQQGGQIGAVGATSPSSCLPIRPDVETSSDPVSIVGPSRMSAGQLAKWFRDSGRHARLSAGMSIDQLARIYIEEGQLAGVRGDVAFAQSIIETGSFSFPGRGQVQVDDNNFAGLGACDSCKSGRRFPSARDGVRAQMQHLRNYGDAGSRASNLGAPPEPAWYGADPATAIHNFDTFFAKGHAPSWLQMGNGNWATDPTYGSKIIGLYARMLRSVGS